MTIQENFADRITGGALSEARETAVEARESGRRLSLELEIVKENMQRLEQALHSPQWRRIIMGAENEFTVQGIHDIIQLSRIMTLKNTLIKRGVEIKRLYIWAQGVQISAVEPEINEVVQSFLDDPRNQQELTSHQARGEKEESLSKDGNIFFRFHVNRLNGRVKVSSIDPLEIIEIICNPEDKKQPWLYKRSFSRCTLDGKVETVEAYYPDFRFNPRFRNVPKGWAVDWSTPIYHVRENPIGSWGIPRTYASLDWALSYKRFLEQLATVWEALARWAFKLTTKQGSRGVASAKKKLNTTVGTTGTETNPPPATGSIFMQSDQINMQPFKTAGATMSADDGRRLMLMGIMNAGFPETFYGDVSVGTLATAKSLDRPTELLILDSQTAWSDIFRNILNFAVLWAVKAPMGMLRNSGLVNLETENDGNMIIEKPVWLTKTIDDPEAVEKEVSVDPTINIVFPSIVERDLQGMVSAIIDASTLKGKGSGIPVETAVRRLLIELGFDEIDQIMDIWAEQEAERAEMASALADQMKSGGGNEDEADDDPDGKEEEEDTAQEAFLHTINTVIHDLREAENGA